MFDLSPDTLLNLLNLLWAVFGAGILWLFHRIVRSIVQGYSRYMQMAKVILGDPDHEKTGIAERLNVMEQSEELNREQRQRAEESHTILLRVGEDLTSLREEVAVNTASYEALSAKVASQDESLTFIRKELTHNGGGSVKDMARDAAHNSFRTLTLIRARDDLDPSTAYFSTDIEGEYNWVSETFLTWTKFQPSDLLGYGWMNAVAPDDRQRVREEWDNAIEDDRDFIMEFRMWTRTREPFWARVMAKKVADNNGRVSGWYGSVKRMAPEEIAAALAEI